MDTRLPGYPASQPQEIAGLIKGLYGIINHHHPLDNKTLLSRPYLILGGKGIWGRVTLNFPWIFHKLLSKVKSCTKVKTELSKPRKYSLASVPNMFVGTTDVALASIFQFLLLATFFRFLQKNKCFETLLIHNFHHFHKIWYLRKRLCFKGICFISFVPSESCGGCFLY